MMDIYIFCGVLVYLFVSIEIRWWRHDNFLRAILEREAVERRYAFNAMKRMEDRVMAKDMESYVAAQTLEVETPGIEQPVVSPPTNSNEPEKLMTIEEAAEAATEDLPSFHPERGL